MKFLFSVMLAILLYSCAGQQTPQKSNLTFANVKKNLVKGKTTQTEIIQTLGSPNITSRNRGGEEVWTYSRQSYDSESGSVGGMGAGVGGGFFGLFGGNKAFSSSSSATFDLIVTFDKNDVVKDYAIVSSKF